MFFSILLEALPGPLRCAAAAAAAKGFLREARNIERVVSTPAKTDSAESAGIGGVLRRARADRGLTLTDLQARTRVHVRYLAALEEERFADLPPYPFARGFLHAAAEELGLDPRPLTRRLAEVMPPRPAGAVGHWARMDGTIVPAVRPSRARQIVVTAAVVVALTGGALAAYLVQQVRQFQREPVPPAAPALAPPAPAGAIPTATATPAAGTIPSQARGPARGPAPTGSPPGAAVAVEVRATGRSWLLVVADQRPVFEGFVHAGDVRRWDARTAIRLRVGNAGAVTVAVDGRDLGRLGGPGEVVDRTYPQDATP